MMFNKEMEVSIFLLFFFFLFFFPSQTYLYHNKKINVY
jgi:hypothetical protein